MAWKTVQQCYTCWAKENPKKEPYRLYNSEIRMLTHCVTCNEQTASGIYVRKDVK